MNIEERIELKHETERKIEMLLGELEDRTGYAVKYVDVRSKNITKFGEIDETFLRRVEIAMDVKFNTKWPHQNP